MSTQTAKPKATVKFPAVGETYIVSDRDGSAYWSNPKSNEDGSADHVAFLPAHSDTFLPAGVDDKPMLLTCPVGTFTIKVTCVRERSLAFLTVDLQNGDGKTIAYTQHYGMVVVAHPDADTDEVRRIYGVA